ncbi:MAG: Rne/Rng family ribonuclease [Bryobacterales bacterium]|nr:Rne/Rng family ribonuclease [Bryobacterales bacterium]
MSKELVVSSNRHETRVALLEDDQLVEIYYQREKEYSLAGSIHKGRVTRVLPGMQSAFVDIGLDRDAFLYVSDFFEDNDEYDKIVTSVEDSVLGITVKPAAEGDPTEAGTAAVSEAREVLPAGVPSAPTVSESGLRPAGQARDGERAPRDGQFKGGRRNRRRRGGDRGFPESKYARPGAIESEPVGAPEDQAAIAEAIEESFSADFSGDGPPASERIVLPGESLAKYRRGEERPSPQPDAAAETEAAPVFESATATAPEVISESVEGTAIPEAGATIPEPVEETAPEPQTEPEAETVVEAAVEVATEPAEAVEAIEADASGEERVESPEASAEVATEPAEAVEAVEADASGEERVESPEASADEADAPTELEIVEPEGVEPARTPTSLTAQLREQGARYQHRASRRSRRRGRGGEGQPGEERPDRQNENRPRERTAPEPVREVRAADPGSARPERPPLPSISDLLREGQEIIVQIAKEPLGQKGARITSHIALPGRYVVYMPTVDHIGVSRKIPSEDERSRLKRILQTHHVGIPGGFIVRTAGERKTEEELKADMMFLYNLWIDLRQKAEKRPAPLLVHHDLDLVARILRDQLTANFKTVWVDNEEVYENVLGFVQRFQPALVSRVKLYTRPTPIFDAFNVTQELEKALRPKVWLKSGGYIVINQTEALVAIDINTGKYVGKSNRLEDTIVKTNTDAIKEIVRQIRLRDLGGIIVVDFIDMDERKNRQKVMMALEEAMRTDKAPNKILQFNDFGLVAITRKRVKQSLERTLCSPCSYCEGAGYVKSVDTVIGEILQEANKIARAVEGADVILRVHPEVAKTLKSNRNNYLQELEEILGRNVLIKSDAVLHQEKFDLS